ncbi:MAG: hypothetical protein A2561_03340 [Candidatus Staskawiczbacteria bacterium RIFOXYD1_FULL_32_13]|uniref:Uncharacterized protein n=1 Tax=Candidatus Staskawiczbacteria bacterium RIFOXYD1_FULL_32_13 TaxID=1802234 RepID=A0A1G2JN26_9BACT|nr:MAG: hypothetical protein A2256_02290 [Candidatus Staskawiczbacteria bacterium RIFOXYA2_FULL_32_7]OGZ87700.1 MAG: hypothetical protein A2561_03340 [Candidatus Staskawiczbacteria bacterium RIFOXYD1_FULL_32_13]
MENRENKLTNCRDKIIIDAIRVEEIQCRALDNFGRELTDIELNRLLVCGCDEEELWGARFDLVIRAICEAINNTNNCWKKVDEDYIKSLGEKNGQ